MLCFRQNPHQLLEYRLESAQSAAKEKERKEIVKINGKAQLLSEATHRNP